MRGRVIVAGHFCESYPTPLVPKIRGRKVKYLVGVFFFTGPYSSVTVPV